MADIAFAKLGKSIIFSEKKWGPIGGDNEAPFLLYMLAKKYPQHTFWIVGKSDYSRVYSKGLLSNIKDVWSPEYYPDGINPTSKLNVSYEDNPKVYKEYYSYIIDTFKRLNVNISYAFFLYGMWFSSSHYDVIPLLNGTGYNRPLEVATKYSSFILDWLNELKCPWASIVTDPRQYRGMSRDCIHWPDTNLSQIDKVLKFNSTTSQWWPKDIRHHNPQYNHLNKYSGVETMNLFSKLPLDNISLERSGFSMILNQGYPTKGKKQAPRYTELKKWILNTNIQTSIYGKWDEQYTKDDDRFKGILNPNKLGTVLNNIKYTLCIPIAAEWVTAKFIEMVHFGVLPFVTASYGKVEYIPNALIVNNSSELEQRIQWFDDHPDAYIAIMKKLKESLSSMYTGDYLLNYLEKHITFDIGKRTEYNEPVYKLFMKDIHIYNEMNTIKEAHESNAQIDEFF